MEFLEKILKGLEPKYPKVLDILEKMFPVRERMTFDPFLEGESGFLVLRIEAQPLGVFGWRHKKEYRVIEGNLKEGLIDLFVNDQRTLAKILTMAIIDDTLKTDLTKEWSDFFATIRKISNSKPGLGITNLRFDQ